MEIFKLDKESERGILSATGLSSECIANMDVLAVDKSIERRNGSSLKFARMLGGLLPRGSVFLMFNRFLTRKAIDRKLRRIK